MPRLWKNREVSRVESLSDAVFGFAATLLVVSLEVPNSLAQLRAELADYPAFGVCFFALILIWIVHNGFFRRYRVEDRGTIVINATLLFVMLFYVYPLKFAARALFYGLFGMGTAPMGIGSLADLGTMFLLYSGGFAALFLCVAALYLNVWRQRAALSLSPEEASEALFLARHYLIFVGVGLFSILLARIGVGLAFGLPGMIYFVLGPLCFAHGVWSERRRRRVAAATPAA